MSLVGKSGASRRRREGDLTKTGFEDALARRQALAGWVAREIIPYEARIRKWLARSRLASEDVEEVLQEAYCRIAMLDAVDHIDRPGAYFFSIARNLLLRRIKRQSIVSFESIAEIESLRDDELRSPEEQVGARLAYLKVLQLISVLPARCRRVVELRKIEGWSQREIAQHLGMSEKAVEKQVWLGVRAIRAAWDRAERLVDVHQGADRVVGGQS